MYGSLDISTSGMIAQRTRLTVVAANLANKNTMLDANGEYNPYKRRIAHFSPGDPTAKTPDGRRMGVHVAHIEIDQNALREEFDPGSPYADERGYVKVPDINSIDENVNAMEAARAYEANVAAAEATKSMISQALRLLA